MNENVTKFFELYAQDAGLRARVSEAEKAVRKAVKSKNPDEMLSAADRLEHLLDELGVTNGSGPYRPAGGYENPNDDVEDEAVDAEYESVDDSRS